MPYSMPYGLRKRAPRAKASAVKKVTTTTIRARPIRRRYRRARKGAIVATSTNRYDKSRGVTLFPSVKSVKMLYSDSYSFAVNAASVSTQKFRGNSIFQCDATSNLGKPRGFSTYLGANNTTAPYNSFCVNAFRIDCQCRNLSNDYLFVSICAAPTAVDSDGPNSLAEARERSDTIVGILPPKGQGAGVTKLTMFGRNAKILGRVNLLDVASSVASYDANPSDSVLITVSVWNPDGAGQNIVKVDASITYYTKLIRKNDIVDS